jgi:hypothetical protein
MNPTFEIGEIAIVQNQVAEFAWANGTEVIVISELSTHWVFNALTWQDEYVLGYVVLDSDGCQAVYLVADLRKKRPPPEYTGETRIRELFNVSPVQEPELA